MCSCNADRTETIAVVDEIVDVKLLVEELPGAWAARVLAQGSVPSGPGIVALLAGPSAEVTGLALDRLPDLRVVVVTSMGWDHVDSEAANSRGVEVFGVEPYCVDEVAEHTLSLILDLLRGVTWLDASVRAGRWDCGGMGRTVRGTILGLVGLGRIGTAVAWRAVALGMVVLAFDPLIDPESPPETSGVRMVPSLDALVSSSDVVSLHVPLRPETKGLVDGDLLARFRPGSYLVNVSRGDVVAEAALGQALREGRIAGAALDVLVNEPPAPNDPVLALPRTVITPHSAWYSPAAVDRVSRSAGRALARAIALIERRP
jgi:D-3-phosphoglycerate dehydrogenase / 2-oxoglutarate reductase